MTDTVFSKRIASFYQLSAGEAEVFTDLLTRARDVREGEPVYHEATAQSQIFIVQSGWLYSYAVLPDGSRQIHNIYYPGDVVGLDHLSWNLSTSSVAAATDATFYEIPSDVLRRAIAEHPRLGGMLYTLHMVNNVLLLDRLTAVARLSAYNSLAFFLSDAYARSHKREGGNRASLDLPLTQEFIADCLGLSAVHVSRQYKKLSENGLIERPDRKTVILNDVRRLQKICDYTDRYADLKALAAESDTGQHSISRNGQQAEGA